MKKKVITNVEGLGYPSDDLEYLKNLPKETPGCHHVRHMIQILNNTFTINTNFEITPQHIPLKPFIFYLKNKVKL